MNAEAGADLDLLIFASTIIIFPIITLSFAAQWHVVEDSLSVGLKG